MFFSQRSFVHNGAVHSTDRAETEFFSALTRNGGLMPELAQPWVDRRGRPCVTLPTGNARKDKDGNIVTNTNGDPLPEYKDYLTDDLVKHGLRHPALQAVWNAAYVSRDEGIKIQQRVIAATRSRLRVWADLAAANTLDVGGLGNYTVEYEMENDPGEAFRHMELVGELRRDESQTKIGSVPIPITQAGFEYTQRRLAHSATSGRPVQTRNAERAGRRIAEAMERVTLGTSTGVTWGTRGSGYGRWQHDGTSTEYGYTNCPYRFTKTDMHTPSASSPEQVLEDFIEATELMHSNDFHGPFIAYVTTGYDRFLKDDYFRTGGTSAVRSLRERLLSGPDNDITEIRRVDLFTTGYQVILVDMSGDTAVAAIAQNITTIQWPDLGGAIQKWRVFMAAAPLIYHNYAGETGILHGTTS